MCMICKGLERGKFSPEDARDKLEEFVDLDLLDEDHQEEVEMLISEIEEDEYYWSTAKKDARRNLEEEYDYGYNEEEIENDSFDEEPYEED